MLLALNSEELLREALDLATEQDIPSVEVSYEFAKAMVVSMYRNTVTDDEAIQAKKDRILDESHSFVPGLTYAQFFPKAREEEELARGWEHYGNLTVKISNQVESDTYLLEVTSEKLGGLCFTSELIVTIGGNDVYKIGGLTIERCGNCSEFFATPPEGQQTFPLVSINKVDKIHGLCLETRSRKRSYNIACDKWRSEFTEEDLESQLIRPGNATIHEALTA